MKEIPLTQGKVALVDDEDFERVNKLKWYAHREGDTFYAIHKFVVDGSQKGITMQQFLLDVPKGRLIDHKNGEGLDNQRANIRECSKAENVRNCKKNCKNTTGYKGVTYIKGMFIARIKFNYKKITLGRFKTAIEAALAYDEGSKKYHGEFGRTNF